MKSLLASGMCGISAGGAMCNKDYFACGGPVKTPQNNCLGHFFICKEICVLSKAFNFAKNFKNVLF